MIDWNNNGEIDPVDIGISIAILPEEETDEMICLSDKKASFFDRLKDWLGDKHA